MAQFNVHEAKTHFTRLLDLVIEGEEPMSDREVDAFLDGQL